MGREQEWQEEDRVGRDGRRGRKGVSLVTPMLSSGIITAQGAALPHPWISTSTPLERRG